MFEAARNNSMLFILENVEQLLESNSKLLFNLLESSQQSIF